MRNAFMTLLLAGGLAACPSGPEAPATAAAPAQAGQGKTFVSNHGITGSRLMQRSTDRNVRIIGADEARSDMSDVRSISNAVGARSN